MKMNELVKKTVKEIVRVILSAVLAGLGLSASGCIANGDSASVIVNHPFTNAKGN
jgi:hypothetical protein